MSGFGTGLQMGSEALDHLRHLRGPKKIQMSVPLAGVTDANGYLTQSAECPVGWSWKITRIAWTGSLPGGAGFHAFALAHVNSRDATNLVEVMAPEVNTPAGLNYYADGVSNNLVLQPGEKLLFTLMQGVDATGASQGVGAQPLAVRLQIEATQVGPAPRQRDDFEREDYEDAPPEEHVEHTAVGGVVEPHPLAPLAAMFRRDRP